MSAGLRGGPFPPIEPDSRHVDLVAGDPVGATIVALERPQPLRHELSDILVDAIHEYLRDGDAVVMLHVDGITRAELDEVDGRYITGWRRRQEFRGLTGAVVAVIEWTTNE